jgi:hypothetical protein
MITDNWARRLFPALLLLLAGCGYISQGGIVSGAKPLPNPYTFFQLEALTLINTHKTMGDHIIGWITDKDCSSPRAERGDSYCKEWPARPAAPPQVYCYSTLARPSCYTQPYSEGNDHLIGFVPASTPIR